MRAVILACAVVLAGCASSKPARSAVRSSEQDPAKARALIGAGAVVIDVRTPDEYADGHLPDASNIPVDQLANRVAEVGGDKSRPVVVYCASGSRAAKAKQVLEAAGYTHVVNGGGYDDLH